MEDNRNLILFFLLSVLIIGGWLGVSYLLNPNRGAQHEQPPAVAQQTAPEKEPAKEKEKEAEKAKEPPAEQHAEVKPPAPARPAEPEPPAHEPITLGDPEKDFFTAVVKSQGASVSRITMRDFQEADKDGKPMWVEPGHQKKRLELVPEEANRDFGSFLFYDADPADPNARPYSRLGKRQWEVMDADTVRDEDGTVRKVVFRTQFGGVRITKTYTLNRGDYHLGLDIGLENTTKDDVHFRYHLASAHGLPIEAEWTNNVKRNGIVLTVDDQGGTYRSLQDLGRISFKGGGEEVQREGKAIQAGGVAVQYFSSMVTVAEQDLGKKFLSRARPTIETAVLRGTIADAPPDGRPLEVTTDDHVQFKVDMPPDVQLNPPDPRLRGDAPVGPAPAAGVKVAIIYRTDDHDRMVARKVYTGDAAGRLLFDDIDVHLVSEDLTLRADEGPVTHHYLLYNGPVKVALLDYMDPPQRPDAKLVKLYRDGLHLSAVTDSPSPGWLGNDITGPTGLSFILIWFTNRMHFVLWLLHQLLHYVPGSQGLSILLLTLMVRGMMFPFSRRQAMTSIRMQALAPELKKLQEKYKDDAQARGMAQMELYRKHGVNPMGSCWTIVIQMPIFIGLYYALQESIRFRLAPFLWMENLAAPDMLFYWTRSIPVISDPAYYGAGGLLSMFYLGPYFNLLPVVVAAFMLVQQKMMTPPPTDEQQEMQQKMMKFMSLFFALMFYKMAAGLCLYFITSSLWGFTERQLLPKRKGQNPATPPTPGRPSLFQKAFDKLHALAQPRTDVAGVITTAPAPGTASSAIQAAPAANPSSVGGGKRKKNKRKDRNRRRDEAPRGNGPLASGPGSGEADGGAQRMRGWLANTRRNVHAWWLRVLRDAKK